MDFLSLFETAALSLERPRELTPRAIVLSLRAIKSNFWRKAPENLGWRAPLDPLLRDINGLESAPMPCAMRENQNIASFG
jgi:hypothetical protein